MLLLNLMPIAIQFLILINFLELIANLLHLTASFFLTKFYILIINCSGIIGCLYHEKQQKAAFLETRQSLETKQILEQESKEQERLLLSILPEHLATQIRKDLGANMQCQFKKIYMSRYEEVSILFADIVGFTAISSNCKAAELVSILNELFARFDKLANKYHQMRIKILGDCYYAISGAPEKRPDHAVLCVHMGLSMVEAIRSVREKTKSTVDMRVGVHTGAVLAGVLGQRQWQFDVYSKDVELANKMESSGLPGRVHISNATLRFLNNEFEVSEADGESREESLRMAQIKTYFIERVLKPYPEGTLDAIPPKCDTNNNNNININNSNNINNNNNRSNNKSNKMKMMMVTQQHHKNNLEPQPESHLHSDNDNQEVQVMIPDTTTNNRSSQAFELTAKTHHHQNQADDSEELTDDTDDDDDARVKHSARSKIVLIILMTSLWLIAYTLYCDQMSRIYNSQSSQQDLTTITTTTTDTTTLNDIYQLNTTNGTKTSKDDELFIYDQPKFRYLHSVYLYLMTICLATVCWSFFFINRQFTKTKQRLFLWRKKVEDRKRRVADIREKNEALVYNILPPNVAKIFLARPMLNDEELYSKSYDAVGVLFAAMPNFSNFYSEESVNNQGLECLRFLNEVISDYDALLDQPRFKNIIKIKTMGSTYMAASGLYEGDAAEERAQRSGSRPMVGSRSSKDSGGVTEALLEQDPIRTKWGHLEQLTEFALALKETLNNINKESFNNFVLRIGINHGPITAGVIGAKKPHFDMWGNTVNVASRME